MKNLNRFSRMFLYNFFIENGSFNALTKASNAIYKQIAKEAKKFNRTAMQYLEEQIKQGTYKLPFDSMVDYNMFIEAFALHMQLAARKTGVDFDPTYFNNFNSFNHLKENEQKVAQFMESTIPEFVDSDGQKPENLRFTISGSIYHGTNLYLQKVPGLLDDVLMNIRGYNFCRYIRPFTAYKLRKMLKETSNLNRIGLDKMGILPDLISTLPKTPFNTIKELLEADGFKFKAISADKINAIDCDTCYELIISNYHEGQILLDKKLYHDLCEMNIVNDLEVVNLPLEGVPVPILTTIYNGKTLMVHTLVTRKNDLNFKDRNPLNLTVPNLV